MKLDLLMIDFPINDVGMTVFAYACANSNNRAIIETIWARNPVITAADFISRTPLHHVVRKRIDVNAHEDLITNC